MKKIHSILLGMGLITGGLMLAGWTSGETVTLEEIDTATQTEQLLKNHSSFQITSVYVDDDFTYSQFVKCSVFKSLYSFVHSQIAYKIKYFLIVQTLPPCAFLCCMSAMVASRWQCHH